MVGAKIGVLFLIAVGIGLAVFFGKRWGDGSRRRSPGRRHWITRSVCGTVGGGILLAFLVVTVQDVRASRSSERPISLRIPTLRAPEPPARKEDFQQGRYLLQMAVTQGGDFPGAPVASESYEVQWPRDRDRLFSLSWKEGSRRVELTQAIHGIELGPRNKLEFSGSSTFSASGPYFSHSQSGPVSYPSVLPVGGTRNASTLFSIAKHGYADLLVLCDISRLREEDPLRPASLEEWIAGRGYVSWYEVVESERAVAVDDDQGSPAAFLLLRLGVNFLPLLAAALLLAQLFRRRPLGFVKVAAGLILALGALDRVVLQMNESRLRDAAAPLTERMTACEGLRDTLFFRHSALADLRKVAADGSVPKPLAARAAKLIAAEK
jgi:hypothetical protein